MSYFAAYKFLWSYVCTMSVRLGGGRVGRAGRQHLGFLLSSGLSGHHASSHLHVMPLTVLNSDLSVLPVSPIRVSAKGKPSPSSHIRLPGRPARPQPRSGVAMLSLNLQASLGPTVEATSFRRELAFSSGSLDSSGFFFWGLN